MPVDEVFDIEGTIVYVIYTGTTPGHEHHHGEILVNDKVFTFYGKTYRKGFYYTVHGYSFSARNIERLARKCYNVLMK